MRKLSCCMSLSRLSGALSPIGAMIRYILPLSPPYHVEEKDVPVKTKRHFGTTSTKKSLHDLLLSNHGLAPCPPGTNTASHSCPFAVSKAISGVTIIPFDCLIGVSVSPTITILTEGIDSGLEPSSRERVLRISSGPTQSRAIASGKIVIAIRSGAVIVCEVAVPVRKSSSD
jgi:hypothetical protein